MKQEIKGLFPDWCEETKVKYDCIMSDDIDSLMCAMVQERIFNNKVKHFFYSNSTGGDQRYYSVKNYNAENELLGLDIALESGKCWDNHVVKVASTDITNSYSANVNIALNIFKGNYTKKAIVSSFITMLSYYNCNIQEWSKERLMVLCSIDGLYYPFKPHSNFVRQGTENLKLLGYEFLVDFIQDNLDEIVALEEELNLKGKIWVNNQGKLETNIDLLRLSEIFGFEIKLSEEIFDQTKTFTKKFDRTSKEVIENRLEDKNKTLFNLALVKRDCCVYSYY